MRPPKGDRKGRRWPAGWALILVVLLGGIAGSVAAGIGVDRVQSRHADELLDRQADEVQEAVTSEAGRYLSTLTDLAASVGAQTSLSATDFGTITSKVDRARLPGISGMSFVIPVANRDIQAVQAQWRANGAAGLTLKPADQGPDHMFVILSRVLDGRAAVTGIDLARAAEASEALQVARTSMEVAASRTYVLLRDRSLPLDQRQLSFVLAAPITWGAGTPQAGQFRGWLTMGMRGGDFLNETLRSRSRGAVKTLLTDVTVDTQHKVVAGTSGPETVDDPAGSRLRTVVIGQRTWELLIEPTRPLLTDTDRRMSRVIVGFGLLITVLLSGLVWVLSSSRRRALSQVERATEDLKNDIAARTAVEARLREREGELHHMAFHDPLTGLPNRALFQDRTEHAIARQDRTGHVVAVLFVDLDGFKMVNDEWGHSGGDVVLVEVADRLEKSVRTADTVSRFGGDEFAVLTEWLAQPEDVRIVADRIVRALSEPILVDGRTARISSSVGIALRVPHSGDADDLLREADHAMYTAKTAGKNRYVISEHNETSVR